jgi:hypothetical protein
MKNPFSKIRELVVVTCVFFFCVSCQKTDSITVSRDKPEKELVGYFQLNPSSPRVRINSIHLSQDTVYLLKENFSRLEGEELIVDAGTVVKSVPGIGISIEPGAKIDANGTQNNPIIFTTNLPTGNNNNYWQGIIINGKSVNNVTNPQGNLLDVSGSLRFVRIEFGGLTLNSVGSGTMLENIQVSYSMLNSSFIFNGGSFNSRYLVSYACGAPADFYFTGGYTGNLQYLLAQRHPFFGKKGIQPENALTGVYIENCASCPVHAEPLTRPVISNLTVIGPNGIDGSSPEYSDALSGSVAAMITSRNALFNIRNSIFLAYPLAGWQILDSLSAYNVHRLNAEFTHSIVQSGINVTSFYIKPGIYLPYDTRDFMIFMQEPRFFNRIFQVAEDFEFVDAFNFFNPQPVPQKNSPVLKGADFTGFPFDNNYFVKDEFVGAIGNVNWLAKWTNFQPLKTLYNSPQ